MLQHINGAIVAADLESLFGITKTLTPCRKIKSVRVDGYPISVDKYLKLAAELAAGRVWFDTEKKEFKSTGLDPLVASEIIAAMQRQGVGSVL